MIAINRVNLRVYLKCFAFQEAAKSFIVRENFDEALEMALEKKTDFNFAIDDQGNIYPGRTGTDIITPQSE